MKLSEYVKPALLRPLSKLGRDACDAYEALPNELNFRPSTPGEALSRVLSYGVPLAIVGKNVSFEKMIKRSIPAILQTGNMERHVWGVMYAGALLRQLGGEIEFPKENNDSRTPDIRARWKNSPVDCEVTTVEVKAQQERLQTILDILSSAIGMDGRDWHTLIHLGEIPGEATQEQIVDAVLELTPGQTAGVEHAWHVQAVPPGQGDALTGGAGLEELRPEWWIDDGPTLFVSGLTLSSNPENTRRLRICAKLSFVSYYNSIERKVQSQQRDPSNPYVIVVNQGAGRAMPMRHNRLVQELAGYLPLWDHVSAILLFDWRAYPLGPFCWKLSLHINADARIPAPEALSTLLPSDQQVCVSVYE